MKNATITRGGYFFVALWGLVILLFYAVVGFVQVRWLQAHRAETIQSRQLQLQGGATEIIKPVPDIKAQHPVKPVEVGVGIYVNHMGEFAVKEAIWTADFDIWFRWAGTSVNPGETFRLVNGEIETREKHEAYASGDEHYARYRVKARIGKYFDPIRFPFADDRLTIEIEDSVHRVESFRYVANAKR